LYYRLIHFDFLFDGHNLLNFWAFHAMGIVLAYGKEFTGGQQKQWKVALAGVLASKLYIFLLMLIWL